MDKSELRKKTIKYLNSFSLKEREQIEEKLANNLLNEDMWKNAQTIGITIAQGFEWDTKGIIETAWKEGKNVCVPKSHPTEKRLDFYRFESYDQLEVVYYDLQEPIPDKTVYINKNIIDLIIVPGLLFDHNGYRIGFGGGFYDRFLADFPNDTVSIFSTGQLSEQIPAESYDIAVQHLITETGKVK